MKKMIILNLLLFMTMLLILSMLNYSSFHPIFIMIMIIIYTIILCLNMSMWKSNYIYSMVLFLMMISGLMNIFLYFSSLISNENMYFYSNSLMLSLLLITMMLNFYIIFTKKSMINININYMENNLLNKINEKMLTILHIYTYPYNNITIMLMGFLIMTLFTIIKILTKKLKPLRKII